MRKPLAVNPGCKRCSEPFTPTSTYQFYCNDCRPIVAKETKRRWYKKNFPDAYKERPVILCAICGEKFNSRFEGVPYCKKHYSKARYYGDPNFIPPTTRNTYTVDGDVATLTTTRGDQFKIDASDLEEVIKRTWCISKTGYVVAGIDGKTVKLTRHLLKPPRHLVVDHINGDPLDNRRANLRTCKNSGNCKNNKLQKNNTTGYPGVRKTPSNTYHARITVNYEDIYIGAYPTFEEAVKARKAAEIKHYGKFSPSLGALKDLIDTSTRGESTT